MVVGEGGSRETVRSAEAPMGPIAESRAAACLPKRQAARGPRGAGPGPSKAPSAKRGLCLARRRPPRSDDRQAPGGSRPPPRTPCQDGGCDASVCVVQRRGWSTRKLVARSRSPEPGTARSASTAGDMPALSGDMMMSRCLRPMISGQIVSGNFLSGPPVSPEFGNFALQSLNQALSPIGRFGGAIVAAPRDYRPP